MKRWLIRCTQIAGLAMGALLVTGTAAQADWNTGYNAGLLNGNQTSVSVRVPVNVSNNALAIGGFASAHGNGDSSANGAGAASMGGHKKHHKGGGAMSNGGAMANGGGGSWSSGPNAGVLNGNQTAISVDVPITVCGNAIAIFGFASASC
jgi:hypothetical protein